MIWRDDYYGMAQGYNNAARVGNVYKMYFSEKESDEIGDFQAKKHCRK